MQEKENLLRILKETLTAVKKSNSLKLKKLSDQTNHSATIYQDPDNVIVAVLVYSLSKIVERENYKRMPGWGQLMDSVLNNLKSAIRALEKDKLEEFRTALGNIRSSVNTIDGSLKDYINDVFYKAGINRAFKYYEHGLSSQRTAELLGVSLWDLNSYIGQSNISESKISETMPVKDRIKVAESFLE